MRNAKWKVVLNVRDAKIVRLVNMYVVQMIVWAVERKVVNHVQSVKDVPNVSKLVWCHLCYHQVESYVKSVLKMVARNARNAKTAKYVRLDAIMNKKKINLINYVKNANIKIVSQVFHVQDVQSVFHRILMMIHAIIVKVIKDVKMKHVIQRNVLYVRTSSQSDVIFV